MTDRSGAGDAARHPPALVAVLLAGGMAQGMIFMVVSPLLPRMVAGYGDRGAEISARDRHGARRLLAAPGRPDADVFDRGHPHTFPKKQHSRFLTV